MDGTRFDDLARTVATSRRGALKALLAGLVGGAGGLLGLGVAAQGCAPVRRRCGTDGECCSGLCDPASGRCACGPGTEQCGLDCIIIEQYQSDEENCGGCRVRCRRAPECQLPACIAGACAGVLDPDQVGQPCGRGGEVCGADGACSCPAELPTACRRGCVDTATDPNNCGACDHRCPRMAHGTPVCSGGVCGIACDGGARFCGDRCCADLRDCCDGACCPLGECCGIGGECSVEACQPHCAIGGIAYVDGTANPDNACQVCSSDRDPFAWSPAPDDAPCGDDRVCCNGICCGPNECCGAGGGCEECAPDCLIGGVPYSAGVFNPNNPCEVCDPSRPLEWSPVADNSPCGESDDQVCCDGVCCIPNWCCTIGQCDNEFCEDPCVLEPDSCPCEIDGVVYPFGTENPLNECQF
ncbi:MAG: hypothetical protein ACRDJW_11660 [Thermomicrobiales bacterium]